MKRIIFAISALAVIAGLSASCQKEMAPDNTSATVNSVLTVTATIADNGTKVSYAEDASYDLTPTWVVDDIIIGFDESDNTYGYKVTAVNDGVATLAIITDGDYKGTATSDPAAGTIMYMIYAPGYMPTNISSKSLTVSLASQSKDVVPALMMAQATVANSSLNLSFENKTAIIGIKTPTMAIAGKKYTGIAVSGTGINTEVKFGLNASSQLEATYQTPGTIVKAVDFTSGTDNTTSATIYVVACPLETAADLTFTASNGEKFKKESKTMTAGQYYYMTPEFKAPEALSGVFTVGDNGTPGDTSDDVKVRFSPGNLRCYPIKTAGTYTSGLWGFFDKQYECGPGAYSDGHDKEISLFTWGYDAAKSIVPDGKNYVTGHTTDGEPFDPSEDWGSALDDKGTWRTLTTAEWQYLFNTRSVNSGTQEGKSYQRATIKLDASTGVYGMILYPDNYTAQTVATEYSVTDWEAMEANGCVFLPAAGYRSGSDVGLVGDSGSYWSSSAYFESSACLVLFDSDNVYPDSIDYRDCGFSVRLITDASAAPAPTPTTTGTATRTGDIDVNWVQLWENGPKFAEYNVGAANNKAEDYGGYYTWGGTYKNGTGITWQDDHNTSNTGPGNLSGDDDTVTKLWGSKWRMPTQTELEALLNPDNCTCTWTENYNGTGVNGLLCKGKDTGYSSNSVFLPAAGRCGSDAFDGQGIGGCYWSSTPSGSGNAYYLLFHSGGQSVDYSSRSYGYSVRAVLAEDSDS